MKACSNIGVFDVCHDEIPVKRSSKTEVEGIHDGAYTEIGALLTAYS